MASWYSPPAGTTDGAGRNRAAVRGLVQLQMLYIGALEALGATGKWKL